MSSLSNANANSIKNGLINGKAGGADFASVSCFKPKDSTADLSNVQTFDQRNIQAKKGADYQSVKPSNFPYPTKRITINPNKSSDALRKSYETTKTRAYPASRLAL